MKQNKQDGVNSEHLYITPNACLKKTKRLSPCAEDSRSCYEQMVWY